MRDGDLNPEVAPGSIWLYLMLYAVGGLTLLGTLLGAHILEENDYSGWLAVPVAYDLLSSLSYVLPELPQDIAGDIRSGYSVHRGARPGRTRR